MRHQADALYAQLQPRPPAEYRGNWKPEPYVTGAAPQYSMPSLERIDGTWYLRRSTTDFLWHERQAQRKALAPKFVSTGSDRTTQINTLPRKTFSQAELMKMTPSERFLHTSGFNGPNP
jgi:hypothetical protein